MKRNLIVLPAALIGASLLGGCGFMHRHFDHKTPAYANAVEARPLEVPPDLDAPNHSGALVVPPPSAASTNSTSQFVSAAPATGAPGTAPPAAVLAPGVALGGDSLHVTDTLESTWSRVGLALERSGAAAILSRDESARTYAVETTGQTTTKPGWLKRVVTFGHAGTKTTAKVQLVVRVTSNAANASTVSVEGADSEASRNAAQALLATLRERLS
ncbi:MAG: hypothetical protein ABI082_10785 [Dokdonella sp.]